MAEQVAHTYSTGGRETDNIQTPGLPGLTGLRRCESISVGPDIRLGDSDKCKLFALVSKEKAGRVNSTLFFKPFGEFDTEQFEQLSDLHKAIPNNSPEPVVLVEDEKGNSKGYLMTYIEGVPLGASLASLNKEQLETVVKNLKSVIALMHKNGVVHGDLDIANVIVRKDLSIALIDPDYGDSIIDLDGNEIFPNTLDEAIAIENRAAEEYLWRCVYSALGQSTV